MFSAPWRLKEPSRVYLQPQLAQRVLAAVLVLAAVRVQRQLALAAVLVHAAVRIQRQLALAAGLL
eukprot:6127547-Pyramimonas_sp.AAC.1